MRGDRGWWVLIGAALLLGGCATGAELAEWQQHSSHFASKDHMVFSLRNAGGSAKVTRRDLSMGRDERWWGQPVTVSQQQILDL